MEPRIAMSEHLTHIAVFEDCARLVSQSEAYTEAFKVSLPTLWDAGLLASAARGNHLFAVPLLETYRTRWASRTDAVVSTRTRCTSTCRPHENVVCTKRI